MVRPLCYMRYHNRKDLLAKNIYPSDPDSVYGLISGGPKILLLSKFSEDERPPLLGLLRTHKSKFLYR